MTYYFHRQSTTMKEYSDREQSHLKTITQLVYGIFTFLYIIGVMPLLKQPEMIQNLGFMALPSILEHIFLIAISLTILFFVLVFASIIGANTAKQEGVREGHLNVLAITLLTGLLFFIISIL